LTSSGGGDSEEGVEKAGEPGSVGEFMVRMRIRAKDLRVAQCYHLRHQSGKRKDYGQRGD